MFVALLLTLFGIAGPVICQTQQSAPDGQLQLADLGTCKLVSGRQIENCRLGYGTWGKLNPDRSNAVLFPSWFSGNSESLSGAMGPGGLVDPAKYFVITVDALGDGVSSSPSNSTAQPGPDFPAFTLQDMVNPEPALKFAKSIGAKTFILEGDCGHIATGCEAAALNPVVRAFLDGK